MLDLVVLLNQDRDGGRQMTEVTGAVHVWQIDAVHVGESSIETGLAILSSEERARASRLRDKNRRAQFIVSRVGIRCVLAGYQRCTPSEVEWFSPGQVAPSVSGMSCSLSHSEGRTFLALAPPAWRLGVDLELVDSSERREGLRRFCLEAGYPLDEDRSDIEQWVEREAIFKCFGRWPVSSDELQQVRWDRWSTPVADGRAMGVAALAAVVQNESKDVAISANDGMILNASRSLRMTSVTRLDAANPP